MKYGTPVTAEYKALDPKSTIAADPATNVIEKNYITTKPIRNRKR